MPLAFILALGAAGFLAIAVGIVTFQRRRKSCPLHQRRAGQTATALAWFCAAIGLVLGALAAWSA